MALIQVTLQRTQPIGGKKWSALQTLKSAARGLITAGKVLADIIWLVVFFPIWGAILAIVLWLKRRRARRAASKS